MSDVLDYYENLSNKCIAIGELSRTEEYKTELAKCHSLLFDYELWLNVLEGRPEHSIFKMAIREYQLAFLCNILGMYNQSFLGLRFFLERTLVAILFSAKEIELRLWHLGERDTYWSEIMDDDNGIFSHKFCKAFFAELKDDRVHYSRMTSKVYRECSEYVHGNLKVQTQIPESLEFSEQLFKEWHAKAVVIKQVVIFCFMMRYSKSLSEADIEKLEPVITEHFGFMHAAKLIFKIP